MVAVRKPFEPVPENVVGRRRAGNGQLASVSPIVRNRQTTVGISAEAFDKIYRLSQTHGSTFGAIAGQVVDYLARHDRLDDVLQEALKEWNS